MRRSGMRQSGRNQSGRAVFLFLDAQVLPAFLSNTCCRNATLTACKTPLHQYFHLSKRIITVSARLLHFTSEVPELRNVTADRPIVSSELAVTGCSFA
jgi:hypothetical protein